jgi:hypothetical protein
MSRGTHGLYNCLFVGWRAHRRRIGRGNRPGKEISVEFRQPTCGGYIRVMTIMPSALPRLIDPVSLGDDPLAFLAGARSRVGDAIILGEGAPFFSPAADCPGVVALFGSHYHRQVLGDYRSFVSTRSAARALGLPENIVNLNRSLHSMQGRQHEAHKAVLAGMITSALLVRQQASIVAVWAILSPPLGARPARSHLRWHSEPYC